MLEHSPTVEDPLENREEIKSTRWFSRVSIPLPFKAQILSSTSYQQRFETLPAVFAKPTPVAVAVTCANPPPKRRTPQKGSWPLYDTGDPHAATSTDGENAIP
jgi:hypothetical protein